VKKAGKSPATELSAETLGSTLVARWFDTTIPTSVAMRTEKKVRIGGFVALSNARAIAGLLVPERLTVIELLSPNQFLSGGAEPSGKQSMDRKDVPPERTKPKKDALRQRIWSS
jgi:hypothetical protein